MRKKKELGEGHNLDADEGQCGLADAQTNGSGAGQGVSAQEGQDKGARPFSDLIGELRYWHRQRVFAMEQRKRADLALGSFLRSALGWSRALPEADRKRINIQAQALMALGEAEAKGKGGEIDEPAYLEWGPVILASIAAREPFSAIEDQAEKQMAALAKQLPVWPAFGEPIRGFGPVSLAIIVAEAGDLSGYPEKGHLWKRMGVAVLDGVRQGGLTKSASKEAWIEHGYNRMRRSRMWNIGDSLIKGNGDGDYRRCYLVRKDYERKRAEANGLTVAPAAKIPKGRLDEFISDGYIHRRAQRYMEKRLLRDLWQAWRRANLELAERPIGTVPAVHHREAE